MRCAIVSAGPLSGEEKSLLHKDDYIIACDGGIQNCEKMNIRPNLIIGDFDSSHRPETGTEIIMLPHIKDDTDTHYAAKEAVKRGFSDVLLLGAIGGKRIEHMFANLNTAIMLEKRGIHAALADSRSRITFVLPQIVRVYPKEEYMYFSVFPAEGMADGICIHGAFYDTEGVTLTDDFPIGASNEYKQGSDRIEISCEHGILMVVETKDDCQLGVTAFE